MGDAVHLAMVRVVFGSDDATRQPAATNISRDATEVVAREKTTRQAERLAKSKVAKKRNKRAKEPTRLEEQMKQSAIFALSCLPKCCDFGTKMDTSGHKHTWK